MPNHPTDSLSSPDIFLAVDESPTAPREPFDSFSESNDPLPPVALWEWPLVIAMTWGALLVRAVRATPGALVRSFRSLTGLARRGLLRCAATLRAGGRLVVRGLRSASGAIGATVRSAAHHLHRLVGAGVRRVALLGHLVMGLVRRPAAATLRVTKRFVRALWRATGPVREAVARWTLAILAGAVRGGRWILDAVSTALLVVGRASARILRSLAEALSFVLVLLTSATLWGARALGWVIGGLGRWAIAIGRSVGAFVGRAASTIVELLSGGWSLLEGLVILLFSELLSPLLSLLARALRAIVRPILPRLRTLWRIANLLADGFIAGLRGLWRSLRRAAEWTTDRIRAFGRRARAVVMRGWTRVRTYGARIRARARALRERARTVVCGARERIVARRATVSARLRLTRQRLGRAAMRRR